MADRRRIVTLDSAGTATTVLDIEVTGQIQALRGTFTVTPPARKPVLATRQRRYGGARTVQETHDNGSISETLLVKGTSVDTCISTMSTLLAALEKPVQNLFYEWRPDGASNSSFYEIRGPAQYEFTMDWGQLSGGGNSMYVKIVIPVAPLARLTPQTFTLSSTDLPAVLAMTGILGDAPSLADVSIRSGVTATAAAPIWALFGWWKTPSASPIAGSVAPVGVIEAETGTALTTWVSTANAGYRGGNALVATGLAGAGSASASYVVDPSILDPDDFALGEIDIEVWAKLGIDGNLASPRVLMSLIPDAGSAFGNPTYTPEFGNVGRSLTKPSTAGSAFRIVRLGVLTMPVDPSQPVKWRVKVDVSWGSGTTSAVMAMDYLMMVPARSRAVSKSGVANDAFYPKFIQSTSDTTKKIKGQDLSGQVGSGTANQGRDSGLGGSLIELPPGNVSMLLKLSNLVADDPTSDTTTEQLAHTCTGTVTVAPRVFLAR